MEFTTCTLLHGNAEMSMEIGGREFVVKMSIDNGKKSLYICTSTDSTV